MITFAHFNTMNSNHSLFVYSPGFSPDSFMCNRPGLSSPGLRFFLFDRAAILCKTNFLYCQSFSLRRKIDVTSAPIWTSNSASKNSYTKTEPFRSSFEIIPNNTMASSAAQRFTIAQDPVNQRVCKVFPVSNYFQF